MASSNLKTDSIDGVILRLLKLEPGTELDYQTYFDKLKTKIMLANSVKQTLPAEENELLRNELLRVRKIKDKGIRFKVKKVKVGGKSTVSSSQSASQNSGLGRSSVASSSIVKYKGGKGGDLVPYQKEEPKEEKKDKKSLFTDINKTLGSILKTLSSKFKFDQKQADQERKNQETEKRSARESALEGFSRGVGAIVATTQKMLSPFNDIIERIKRFLFFTLLGKAFTMFMNWLSNKENQKKFNTFIEFLTKHWPALAGLYILFGTSFGKLVRGLVKGAIRLTFALLKGIPRLVGIIRKNKTLSRIIIMSLPLVTGGLKDMLSGKVKETKETMALTDANPDLEDTKKTIDKLQGSQGTQLSPGSPPPKSSPPVSGGASPSVPKYNFGGMIPKFAMGGMSYLNPFTMGMGGDFSSGIPIRGAGQDDTLIAAKTGEAILTQKDQSDLGNRFVDRNTGEPLHIPSYLSGRKPGYVSMNNIRPVGGFGGGFAKGGIIQKFNSGGMVGGGFPSIDTGGLSLSPNISPTINTGGLSLSPNISPTINTGGLSLSPNVDLASSLSNRIQNNPINLLGDSNLIASAASPGASSGGKGGKPTYGSKLKFRSPVRGFPNYQAPTDMYGTFFAKIYNIARSLGDPFPEVVAAQAVEESNFGRSKLAIEANNLFGQDAPASAPPERKYEYFDPVEQKHHVAYKFPSVEESIKYRVRIWKQYYGNAKTPAEAIRNIARSGYNPHAKYPGVIDNIMREYGVDPTIPSPMPPLVKRKPKSNNWWDMLNPTNWFNQPNQKNGRQFGGLIEENTGMNIPGTADRQLTALQPGEYVLPRKTVNELGVPFIERLVAMTDKNSEAFLKRSSLNIPEITPLKSRAGGIVNLPPVDLSSAGSSRARASGYAGGSSLPSFSAIASMNDRQQNAKVFYGIG